jgi:hypothetical protein
LRTVIVARLGGLHRDLGQQPLHGQRGAQLMGGVGGEPALALVAGREPVQRVVERVGHHLLVLGHKHAHDASLRA